MSSTDANTLLVVHVYVHVRPDRVADFIAATLDNARASVREPGVARFDVIHRSAEAPAAHKETVHYKRWRDAVADMMAEPRTARRFVNLHPDDAAWSTPLPI